MDEARVYFHQFFPCNLFLHLIPQAVFVGKRNGDKILSVMEMFGLSDRRIEDCFDGHGNADNIDLRRWKSCAKAM